MQRRVDVADEERREKASKRYETCLKRGDSKADILSREAWIACEIVKLGWRAENSAIAASWGNLEKAIREAIEHYFGHLLPQLKIDMRELIALGRLDARDGPGARADAVPEVDGVGRVEVVMAGDTHYFEYYQEHCEADGATRTMYHFVNGGGGAPGAAGAARGRRPAGGSAGGRAASISPSSPASAMASAVMRARRSSSSRSARSPPPGT